MTRKYDLLAICLLIFSAVVTTAIAIDPKGFSLREWQPLLAAILTLGGAGIVYRGATLAYRAAMAKVELDREIDARNQTQRELGIFLRLQHATNILRHEAKVLRDSIPDRLPNKDVEIKGAWFAIDEPASLREAWNSLQSFPPTVARQIAEIKEILYDLAVANEIMGSEVWNLKAWTTVPAELMAVRGHASKLTKAAKETRDSLTKVIEFMRDLETGS